MSVFIDDLQNGECATGGELLTTVVVLPLHVYVWTKTSLFISLSYVFLLSIFQFDAFMSSLNAVSSCLCPPDHVRFSPTFACNFLVLASMSHAWTNMPLYISPSSITHLVVFHLDGCKSVNGGISFCLSPTDTVQFLAFAHVTRLLRCLLRGPPRRSSASVCGAP